MTGFYLLGIFGVLLMAGRVLFDRGYKRGYEQGFTRATEHFQSVADKSFEQGKHAADNWWIAADVSAEAARDTMWREDEST